MVTETVTLYPGAYDSSNYKYASVSNITNPVGKSASNTSYGQINLTTGSSAETYTYWPFDCSSIPNNATIDSVSCSVKISISHTGSSYISSKTAQLYNGTTAKGSATTISSTSATTLSLTCGTWTRNELQNCRLRLYAKRGTSSTSTSRYFRFYGANLTIQYTYNNQQFMIKTNGSWSPVSKVYKKINGSWVEQTDLTNVIDTSKKLVFSSSYSSSNGNGSSSNGVAINISYALNGCTLGDNVKISDFISVKLNNTEYYQGNITSTIGNSIIFKVYAWTDGAFVNDYGYVNINGQRKFTMSANDGDTETYTWTIPSGITSINIVLNFMQDDDAAWTYAIVTTA